MQNKVYLLCFLFIVYVQKQTGSLAVVFHNLCFVVFIVSSPPINKTVFPLKLMESSANLFGKSISLCGPTVWFQSATNKNRTTAAALCVLQLFVW